MKMVLVSRVIRVLKLSGKGTKDKINHAYAFGGVDMSIKTVRKLSRHVPIDYYSSKYGSFKDIVDAVGGVTVNSPCIQAKRLFILKKGKFL